MGRGAKTLDGESLKGDPSPYIHEWRKC